MEASACLLRFRVLRSLDEFLSFLKQLNGFFAIVHEVDDACFLAVDHVRSCPLFYGKSTNAFYVSDDAQWIRTEIGDQRIDEISAAELLLAAYVSGSDTLCPSVKQIQAGETLAINFTSDGFRVTSIRHYEHGYGNLISDSTEQLLATLDGIMIRIFNRLITMARGRTLVVPLSGGCDSRIVLLMLHRLGFDKIVAFSYGKPGNEESQISKRIALSLGIPWEFIPYSKESWSRWRHSVEWKAYCEMADGLSSIPYIKDWPAVWELRKQQLIPPDSMFVPGHLAAHLIQHPDYPVTWLRPGVIEENQVLNSIRETPFTSWSHQKEDLEPKLEEKMLRLLGTRHSYTTEEATDAYERWWWQEYETKFIINSVRVYDFWGYEWWLPLWDLEVAKFWSRVPIAHRIGKNLQIAHMQRLEAATSGLTTKLQKSSPQLDFVSRLLKKTPFYPMSRRLYGIMDYDRHPMAWYGIVPRGVFNRLYANKLINYILAVETLDRYSTNWRQMPVLNRVSDAPRKQNVRTRSKRLQEAV